MQEAWLGCGFQGESHGSSGAGEMRWEEGLQREGGGEESGVGSKGDLNTLHAWDCERIHFKLFYQKMEEAGHAFNLST